MNVLVGYATAHGSTREIAERVGERLRRHGLDADVRGLTQTGDPERYDAYVLGSAVHGRHWLPEALAFLEAHAPELAAKPVRIFSVGMPAALRRPLHLLAGLEASAVSAEFADRVSYRDHPVFSGVVRGDHLPPVGRLALRVFTRGAGDYRDWPRIDAWADGIARVLETLRTPSPTATR
jgi:menaquinone-dependent protoporphyrinogen oxidase